MTQKTLFGEARYKKYEEIVTLTSITDARKAVSKLKKEAKKAKTGAKKIRIKKVMVLAANRARAMTKKKNLRPATRQEKKKIARLYEVGARTIKI